MPDNLKNSDTNFHPYHIYLYSEEVNYLLCRIVRFFHETSHDNDTKYLCARTSVKIFLSTHVMTQNICVHEISVQRESRRPTENATSLLNLTFRQCFMEKIARSTSTTE